MSHRVEIEAPFHCQQLSCPLRLSCSQASPVRELSTDVEAITNSSGEIDILVIGDHSGYKDVVSRTIFAAAEGELLKSIIKKYSPTKNIAYTYLVRGWPVEEESIPDYRKGQPLNVKDDKIEKYIRTASLANHPQREEIISYCRPYLEAEIERFKPKMILVLGNLVKQTLFPRNPSSILNLVGETLLYQGVIPTRFSAGVFTVFKNPSVKKGWEENLRKILTDEEIVFSNDHGKVHILSDLDEAIAYIDFLKNCNDIVAIDTETANLNKRYGNKLAMIQFSADDNEGVVLPYHHAESPFSPNEIQVLNKHLYSLFAEPSTIKNWVTHNAKFENHRLFEACGSYLKSAPIFDTMQAAALLDENRSARAAEFKYFPFSLKQLALDFLDFDGYDKGILRNREEGDLFDLPLKSLAEYGAMDAYITRRLYKPLMEEAERQGYKSQLVNLMYSMYNLFFDLFTTIEYNGSPVDRKYLRHLIGRDSELLKVVKNIEEELKQDPHAQAANNMLLGKQQTCGQVTPLAGVPWIFSFAKKEHPQTLFFDVKGLKPLSYGKSGLGSVNATWQEVNENDPLVAKFREWTLARKMFDSFAVALYNYVDPSGKHEDCFTDCKIRPSYLTHHVVTGRISCRDPNLTAIPRAESPVKKAVKDIFNTIDQDHVIVQVDFRANEVRWAGIVSQDAAMAEAFNEGKAALDEYRSNPSEELMRKVELLTDIHRNNAAKIYRKPIEEVTKVERQRAKGATFGCLFDESPWALAQDLNMTMDEVNEFLHAFYGRFASIAVWKQEMKNMAMNHGYVETQFGRRRRFPIFDLFRDLHGRFNKYAVPVDHRKAVEDALRQSSNMPIQGSAADQAHISAALFQAEIEREKYPWYIQNAVHDSCIMQCPIAHLKEALERCEHWFTTGSMEYSSNVFGINFNVPIEVDFEIGLRWGSLHKWDFTEQSLREVIGKIEEEKRAAQVH